MTTCPCPAWARSWASDQEHLLRVLHSERCGATGPDKNSTQRCQQDGSGSRRWFDPTSRQQLTLQEFDAFPIGWPPRWCWCAVPDRWQQQTGGHQHFILGQVGDFGWKNNTRDYLEVSWRGTPKSSLFNGIFHYKSWFWVPLIWKTPIYPSSFWGACGAPKNRWNLGLDSQWISKVVSTG